MREKSADLVSCAARFVNRLSVSCRRLQLQALLLVLLNVAARPSVSALQGAKALIDPGTILSQATAVACVLCGSDPVAVIPVES